VPTLDALRSLCSDMPPLGASLDTLESVRDVRRLSCMCWRHLRPQAIGALAQPFPAAQAFPNHGESSALPLEICLLSGSYRVQ